MSNYPVGGMPMPEYATPAESMRPKVVTVVAIIGIVIAVLSLLCNIYSGGAQIVQLSGAVSLKDPPPRWISEVGVALAMVGLIIALLWLIISIGLLQIAAWARQWGIWLGVGHLIIIVAMAVVQLALTSSIVIDATYEQMAARTASDPNAPHFTRGVVSAMIIGGTLLSSFVTMILPALMLITLTRPTVVAAFSRKGNIAGYQPIES